MSLAVVTCHYNWSNFDNPKRNLNRFLRQMDRLRVPVYGIELAFPNIPFVTEGREHWRQHRVNHRAVLWQKEALLNHAARTMLPRDVDNIAFIDADIEFANTRFQLDTEMVLRHHPAVQMFENARWTDRTGAVEKERTCVARDHLDMAEWRTHPGFAWAMTREFFGAIGGWYETAPLGAGDLAFCYAMEKREIPTAYHRVCSDIGFRNEPDYRTYVERVRTAMQGRTVGWTPGTVYHEWHGDFKDRRYSKRGEIIRDFDASQDIKRHRLGYYTWTRQADETLVRAMKEYFTLRNEDGSPST